MEDFSNTSSVIQGTTDPTIVTEDTVNSQALVYVSSTLGWMYFTAWTLSFYPQVIINWRRKSVIGYSFDFVAFNFTGFVAYACFNTGLFWIPEIKAQYYKNHPEGVAPVELNDVFFSLHALVITSVTVIQCIIYEKGTQRVNNWARVLLTLAWVYVLITIILAVVGSMEWLDFLYGFSYLKVGVTVLKYMPQAYMNFVRKSTVGWSIGNVLLDFTGGWMSILQMILNAYNGDDWDSLMGNLTKLGLGLVTIIFDSIFIIQHYCLYYKASLYRPIHDVEICEGSKKATEKEAIVKSHSAKSKAEGGKSKVRRRSVSPAHRSYNSTMSPGVSKNNSTARLDSHSFV
ncbi:cystinosin-like [Elysia marginata]|uniref:Cystinosin-like n=1 Tax=Elysia marginata TaxID=1093978 RepID=A0AAV4JWW0_9GAST|nr:cystinosin-like [Elysia marginata]